MTQPLPTPNQCGKCKQWFHTVHICPRDIAVMPKDCPTATLCRRDGCHGECLQMAEAHEARRRAMEAAKR